uniref:ribosomal protein L5 n=1 Tax=Cephaleuros lagerheimii TaxID=2738443 RepID=UPI003002B24E
MNHRLKNFYIESIKPQLKEQLGYSNFHAIPKLEKIVVHRGIGATNQNQRLIDSSLNELSNLTAQKGVITNSKKSIATFDGRGSFSMGLSESLMFPEMSYDEYFDSSGLQITVVTTAKTDTEALALLKAFQMPFRD